jgi:hypothetical protein
MGPPFIAEGCHKGTCKGFLPRGRSEGEVVTRLSRLLRFQKEPEKIFLSFRKDLAKPLIYEPLRFSIWRGLKE